MRWRQDRETGKLYPIDAQAVKHDERHGIIVRGKFDAFKSPIDGSVISNHREYQDHCRKHNVVPAQEFNQEFFDRKAKERAKYYEEGNYSRAEKLARKQEIYEQWTRMERQ